ncbi:MAG: TolC family protein [Prevotella sp.]|nr:TolC family protein [Prevotella sp.]
MKKYVIGAMLSIAMTPSGFAQTVHQLTIEEMFGLIEQNSKSLIEQKTGIDAAEEGVKAAHSQRLPDINVQATASYIGNALLMDRDFGDAQGLRSPHFGNALNVDVRQTIYAGGAINAGIELAKLGLQQATLGMEQSRQNLRFMAIGQYLDLQKLANRAQVVEQNISLMQKLIDNINEKFQQGLALKNDVTRYELQMQTLRLTLVKLQNQSKILNHQLCNTLGLPSGTIIDPIAPTSNQQFAQMAEAQWQSDAAATNQQIQMAGVSERMAMQQEKLAKSALLPKVAVVGNNSFNGPVTFELPPIDKNLNIWYVGVGIQYPLSSLFKSNKALKQAHLQTRQAREETAVVREQLNNKIQSAHTQYMQSYVELETQQKSAQLAKENYEVVNNRYLNQLALITDMLDASNMRLDAELGEVDARINIAYAYYKMKYIAGQL